jgi:hypothetical protein
VFEWSKFFALVHLPWIEMKNDVGATKAASRAGGRAFA